MKTLTTDQQEAVVRLYESDATLLYGSMGSGKTAVALTAAAELIEDGVLDRVIVVGPAKVVANVWPNETEGWEHLRGVKVAPMVGTPQERTNVWYSGATIVCISVDNLPWLLSAGMAMPARMGIIIDELTRFKSPGSQAVRKLRRHAKAFQWRVGMTGTPVSDHWLGLYSMALVLDDGATFGRRYDQWRERYFYPTDYERHTWALRDGGSEQLATAARGLIHEIPDYRGELPELRVSHVPVELDGTSRAVYDEMVAEFCVDEVEAVNEAVLVGKLQQIASGFLYSMCEEPVKRYHRHKIDALLNMLPDEPVVVVYWYQEDLRVLRELLPDARLVGDKGAVDAWNAGEVGQLLLHPRSAGHGVNLQGGGCKMIWLGPQWSRDLHDQTIARLWRQGQKQAVDVTILYAKDTIDEAVLARLDSKAEYDRVLRHHLSAA